jgi:hypothetical protein
MPYQMLVKGTIGLGTFMLLYGFLGPILGLDLPLYGGWWVMVGALVALAGFAALFSLQSIAFDLKERTYTRRQGPGTFPKVTRGSISNIDALVCIAEPNSRMIAGGVTYHLVLHWKGRMEPLMVVQQDTRQLPNGQPLNICATQILERGARYAAALGVPYHDNTHFASQCPVPIWS